MSQRARLQELKNLIDGTSGLLGVAGLRAGIEGALNTPPPTGDPERLQQYANTCAKAARKADEVYATVIDVANRGLPDVWLGTTSERASDVIRVVGRNMDDSATALDEASREIALLGEELATAQQRDDRGRPPLTHALSLLNDVTEADSLGEVLDRAGDVLDEAKFPAQVGVGHLLAAAIQAEEAYHRFARQLNQYTADATAGQLSGGDLTSIDRIMLSEAAVPEAANEESIMSAVGMSRASTAMNEMSPEDRSRIVDLLEDAKSPQEAAYLLKTLAAGYSVDDVVAFGALIHPYGDDLVWLRDRLSPTSGLPDGARGEETDVEFDGEDWTQGSYPTCVASSTVTARAMVDPFYSLMLTTGGHPGDPEHDNGEAFAERLRWEQNRVYDGARPEWNDLPLISSHTGGMNEGESMEVANNEIAEHTGSFYLTMGLNSTQDRRDALTGIEAAVAQGHPVPIAIRGGGSGHQVMIIGHDGDMLEIYNPWGYRLGQRSRFRQQQYGHRCSAGRRFQRATFHRRGRPDPLDRGLATMSPHGDGRTGVAPVQTDEDLLQLDLPDLLRRGLVDVEGGPDRRRLSGDGAVGAAVTLDRLEVMPRSLTFLAEIARAGGASYTAGLAEPLPDPRASGVMATWLKVAAEVSDDGTVLATWLDAVAEVVQLRRRNRELQS